MTDDALPAPLAEHVETVRAEWIDRNGHMNLAYYMVIFDHGTDALLDALGIGEAYSAATNGTIFAAEAHLLYRQELHAGEAARVRSWLLGADAKRLHILHEMVRDADGAPIAVNELLGLHVDMASRRVAPVPPDRAAVLDAATAPWRDRSLPEGAGRRIALERQDRTRQTPKGG